MNFVSQLTVTEMSLSRGEVFINNVKSKIGNKPGWWAKEKAPQARDPNAIPTKITQKKASNCVAEKQKLCKTVDQNNDAQM